MATVVYRSRAVKPLTPLELHELTRAAQARNQREAVTGLMLYDESKFFQWLEGPPDSVDRVMGSIRTDSRHTDIEVLENQPAETRTFGSWTMKLAARIPAPDSWRREVIEPPSEIVEGLRKRPQAAPVLLAKLLPLPAARPAEDLASDALSLMPLNVKTAAILKSVILAKVIPLMTASAAASAPEPMPHRRAAELAELLIAPDQTAARELIDEVRGAGSATSALYATLFEPAARSLGDLWTEDACSEFDVTLGLCRLQNALRLLTAAPAGGPAKLRKRPLVLIAPEPGELHRLGAALDGTVLREAGWQPHCEYPSDDRSLHDLLSSTWFDVLDLSLSVAFRREHRMTLMAKTIAQARRASRNPELVVMVGGRVFFEDAEAGEEVGADGASTTALGVDRSILKTMTATATPMATPVALMQVVASES